MSTELSNNINDHFRKATNMIPEHTGDVGADFKGIESDTFKTGDLREKVEAAVVSADNTDYQDVIETILQAVATELDRIADEVLKEALVDDMFIEWNGLNLVDMTEVQTILKRQAAKLRGSE